MITVNVYSAGEPKGTMEVSHIDGNTTMERFNKDWNDAVDEIDSLTICDMEDTMTNKGWVLVNIEVLDVEY